MRALAWISFCDSTTVEGRKRSTIERTKGRTGGEVSSTGRSPIMAWRSKVCRTAPMNSCRRDGAIEKIGRAHVCTPVTNAHLVCRLLLETKNDTKTNLIPQ